MRRLDHSRSRWTGVGGSGGGVGGGGGGNGGGAATMTMSAAAASRFVAPKVTLEINGEEVAEIKVDDEGKFVDEVYLCYCICS